MGNLLESMGWGFVVFFFFTPNKTMKQEKGEKKKRLSIISICSSWKGCIPNPISNKVSAHLCATQTPLLSPFPANLTPGWRCRADKVAHCVIVGKHSTEISHSTLGFKIRHSHGAATAREHLWMAAGEVSQGGGKLSPLLASCSQNPSV